ncbi:Cytochrome c553 [Loktanella fryxellensis]|uniref:Cytochrome c553 n=1 Tax=Loktanella fryxellensis TaxID=245187 RepID=A0A1H8K7I6_9RHOB|nr:c-type cytochrome [Loktanella fryxellensis]SEN88933.1 Cytochrome c553 [Loktanella fryxellensis]
MRYIILAGSLALAACTPEAEPDPIDGQASFMAQCSACHGPDARGGGAAAAGLPIAPPDLTLIAARNGGTFPRDGVMSTIDGLSRGAHGAVDPMPHFGDGDMGPMIMTDDGGNPMPVPAELLALTDYLQSIQRQP